MNNTVSAVVIELVDILNDEDINSEEMVAEAHAVAQFKLDVSYGAVRALREAILNTDNSSLMQGYLKLYIYATKDGKSKPKTVQEYLEENDKILEKVRSGDIYYCPFCKQNHATGGHK